MKVFVVLVLTVFTAGCNARIVTQNPTDQVEMMKNAFWEYVSKATTTAEESAKQIQQSALGKEVDTFISQSSQAVSRFSDALLTQVAPRTQDLMTKLSREALRMRKLLDKDLVTVNNSLKQYAQDLLSDLQKKVEELRREATTFSNAMNPSSLEAALMKRSQVLRGTLQAQMGPYADEIKEKMEESLGDFQRSLMPLIQNFESQLNLKAQDVQQSLASYRDELRVKLDVETQNMREQLELLWKSFV